MNTNASDQRPTWLFLDCLKMLTLLGNSMNSTYLTNQNIFIQTFYFLGFCSVESAWQSMNACVSIVLVEYIILWIHPFISIKEIKRDCALGGFHNFHIWAVYLLIFYDAQWMLQCTNTISVSVTSGKVPHQWQQTISYHTNILPFPLSYLHFLNVLTFSWTQNWLLWVQQLEWS